MSAYHRLISYIYAYEGGIKGKNTGFAKLETRGTSCRIQVSVRRVFAGGSRSAYTFWQGRRRSVSALCLSVAEMGSSVPSSIVKILKEAAAIWKSAVV